MIFNRLAVAMGGVALISLLKSLQERSRLQLSFTLCREEYTRT
jgi:hypothetical protein